MTQMARVINGSIETVGLPESGTLKDGRSVSGYHLLDLDTLRQEDWVEVTDTKPVYDNTTQDLIHDGYEYDIPSNKVKVKYLVQAKPPPPEPPIDPAIGRQKFRDAVNAATTLTQLKAAILGNETTDTPGAAPDIARN